MFNRTAIMKSAWAQYRRMQGRHARFDRKLFADVLRYVWAETKRAARSQAFSRWNRNSAWSRPR